MKTLAMILVLIIFCQSQISYASCQVLDSNLSVTLPKSDPLFKILNALPNCPQNVLQLKGAISSLGLTTVPTMVSNRGFHNSGSGSFSFFEMVEGTLLGEPVKLEDFYFGHFTQRNSAGDLFLQQAPNGLMIELIAWDKVKGAYNFYELIGDGVSSRWFYRGDSFDIFDDVKKLHLQENPQNPKFGQKLRCSGCHTSGGPIMKELRLPNNDWWTTDRPLNLSGLRPDSDVKDILSKLRDASLLSITTQKGIDQLEDSPVVRKLKAGAGVLSLPEILRPLFATVEINLESDTHSGEFNSSKVKIPSAYWIDPRLGSIDVEIQREIYRESLTKLKMNFPESGKQDADHAWLTPVKSYSDQFQIEKLKEGVEGQNSLRLSEHFILSVLAVDPLNPIFSEERRSLLKFLPTQYSSNWEALFIRNINRFISSNEPLESKRAALNFMSNYRLDALEIKNVVQGKLQRRVKKIERDNGVLKELIRLNRRRKQVADSEISQNPRGQILEPGFRVVFPTHPSQNCANLF